MGGAAALLAAWWAASRLLSSLTDVSPDVDLHGRLARLSRGGGRRRRVDREHADLRFGTGVEDLATRSRGDAEAVGADRVDTCARVGLPGVLVGGQVALSVALLISAGVFLRVSVTAASSDPGFPLSGGLLAEVVPG